MSQMGQNPKLLSTASCPLLPGADTGYSIIRAEISFDLAQRWSMRLERDGSL